MYPGLRLQRRSTLLLGLVLALLIGTVYGTQYASLTGGYNYSVSTQGSKVQFMAYDYAPLVPDPYVVTSSSGVYSLSLGQIAESDSKTYPAAIGIVNCEEGVRLRLVRIEVTGAGEGQISVYAHRNPIKPCSVLANTYGSMAMETLGANEDVYEAGDTGLRYVYLGTSDDNYADGFVLARGTGYGAGELRYSNDDSATYDVASWDVTNGAWVHDSTPSNTCDIASTLTNDATTQSNFAWIELDISVPSTAGTQDFSDTAIRFYFKEAP